ncbi:ORF52 [Vibrio phage VHML]|uniref:ORF52 n=1 Tax=Vibrio phage VHML TaxID=207597 RepID=Q8H9L5_9CAUD|nr:ORF52 [Vibrio phage VHML]AAN12352.1 ORF52 [Vibrio phage VHML]
MVAEAPTWPMIADQFKSIVSGRKLVIYNADYDLRLIYQTNNKHELEPVFYGSEWNNAE